jgi:hypothetical protein
MVKRKYDKLFATYRVTGLVGKPLVFLCFSCPLSFPPVFTEIASDQGRMPNQLCFLNLMDIFYHGKKEI